MSHPSGDTIDVLVVGGGPTGLTMAAELARRGTRVRIVDKAAAPARVSRALFVQPRTLEVFDLMGGALAGQALSRGHPLRVLNLYAGGRRVARVGVDGLDSPFPCPLILPQDETERILGDHLARLGVTVERPVELAGFTRDPEGMTATLRHPDGGEETVRSRWLVGCDGAHSAVRQGLGMPFEGGPYEDQFLRADARVRWPLAAGEAHGFLAPGGLFGAMPLPGDGRYRLMGQRRAPDPGGAGPSAAEVRATLAAVAPVGAEVDDPEWVSVFRVHRRIVPRLRDGRVFLAGDAAHVHSPAGGQGMNTGIQDAFNLGWKLALAVGGSGREGLLDSYQAERHPIAASVLRATDVATRVALAGGRLIPWLVRRVGPLVLSRRWAQRQVREAMSELHVRYRRSPIVGPAGRSCGGLAPGDRAPDASLIRASDGASVRLFELLRDPRLTLLLVSPWRPTGGRPGTEAVAGSVRERFGRGVAIHRVEAGNGTPAGPPWDGSWRIDGSPDFLRRYGRCAPGLVVIRPDGYVGFLGRSEDGSGLMRHLSLMLR